MIALRASTIVFGSCLIGAILLGGCKATPADSENTEAKPSLEPTIEPAPSPEPKPEPAPITAPAPTEPAAQGLRFWVSDFSLRAYDLDGKQVATLAEIGNDARRLPDGRIVMIEEGDMDVLSLVVLDAKGKVTSRVPIPNDLDSETCAVKLPADDVGPMVARLHLQESSDFAIDAAHDQACLTVMDRNQNMADFGVAVAIALADGKAQTAVTFDASGNCPESPGVPAPACAKTSVGEPWVEPASPAEPAVKSWPFAYDGDTRMVSRDAKEQQRLCHADTTDLEDWAACSAIESSSNSGRWMLMTGIVHEGDYIHREIVLFDRSTGGLLQIIDADTPSFVVVTPTQIFDDARTEPIMGMVGESDTAWLPGDRLWIDGKLLIPEQRKIVAIGGRLARTL